MNNRQSTYATFFVSNPAEAMAFDDWLEDRNSDLQSRGESSCVVRNEGVVDPVRLAETVVDFDAGIRPGQVRILSKRFTASPEIVPFVAVLEKWDSDMWLITPFSPYTHPATPGEMETDIETSGLRVVQAWNGRTVFGELLEKSFLFGELGEENRKNALALFRNQLAGTELPREFSAKRGPAIICDADPRCEYVAESIARLRPLSTAVHAIERMRTAVGFAFDEEARREKDKGPVWQPFYGREDYALAAGEKECQRTEVFKVEETELSVTYSPEDGITIFTFYGRDDEPDGRYNGYGLLGGGKFLGTFRNGTISVPSESVKDWYQVVDCSGQEVVLVRK